MWWERIRPEYRDLAKDLEEQCDWSWAQDKFPQDDLNNYKIFLLTKRMAK